MRSDRKLGSALPGALLLAMILPLLAAGTSGAQTLRCGGELVSVGDVKFEVLSKCGEPASKETHERTREVEIFDPNNRLWRRVRSTVTVDQWTYNFGPGGFLYLVTFENGKVMDIESAGFGR